MGMPAQAPHILLAALLTALAAPSALAQNALGDGRGLEANTKVNSQGRNYQRPSLTNEIYFRNAIATGNAPGGLSFRGDIGYSSPSEFRGDLGSDALFAFRRDSLYSGLAGMGIRGTDALQYQFSLTTGSNVTSNLIGAPIVTRLGTNAAPSATGSSRYDASAISPSLPGIDPVRTARDASGVLDTSTTGLLRSTAAYRSTASMNPEIVNIYAKGIEQEPYSVVASPLTGLTSTPLDTPRRRAERIENGQIDVNMPTSFSETVERVRTFADAVRKRQEERAALALDSEQPDPSDPARVLDSVNTDPLSEEDIREASNWLRERLTKLQSDLINTEEPSDDDTDSRIIDDPTGDPLNLEQAVPRIDISSDAGADTRRFTIDPLTLEVIRANNETITYLIKPDASDRNIYAEHMRTGERLLRAERFFQAEERFTRALAVRTGDVAAQIGRLHAQIGAGTVLSASVNLQTLMIEHIELIAQRYGNELLPPPDRMRRIVSVLRERAGIDEPTRPSAIPEPERIRMSCGLLLAYVGYQIDDPEQIRAGLRVIRELGAQSDQRQAMLYEAVWLGSDEHVGEPQPQPAADDTPTGQPEATDALDSLEDPSR